VARGASRKEKVASRRAKRRERWERFFSPWAAACAGAALSVAFLFQRSLTVRALLFVAFFSAAVYAGKKVSLLSAFLVSAGIVLANLLAPVGRVLAEVGPLKVTETALMDGLGKALVFEGLICISKASILPGLRLPGRFGSLVASAFVYYDRIVEYKGKVKPATLIEDADMLMLAMWEEEPAAAGSAVPGDGRRTRPAAAVLLVAAVLGAYALLLVK